ncbi:MAG: TAXI family TRAP transporter solute-binding subunit [Gammaproteobacteria bacterium]
MSNKQRYGATSLRWIAAAAAITFASSALAADSLTFTAGSPGGGYFKAAAAFGEYVKTDIPGTSVTVIPGGGWANVERLDPASKEADVAVLENALASMAFEGTGPTGKKYDFRMLAAFRQPGAAQAVIVDSLGLKSFEEIRDKQHPVRIAMFERHQLATAQALEMLDAYGMSVETIESWGGKVIFTSHGEGIRMIMDGQADMWFTGGSYFPHHKYIELGSKKPFRLLPISKEVAEKVATRFGQETMEVPAGIYDDNNGKNDAYWSPATIVTFGVRTDLPDDLVYKMAAALANHQKEFWEVHKMHKFYKPEVAWQNVGTAPLHPGAIKYYKEKGYMK